MKSKCDRKIPGIPGEALNTPRFVAASVVVSALVVDCAETVVAGACLRITFISSVPVAQLELVFNGRMRRALTTWVCAKLINFRGRRVNGARCQATGAQGQASSDLGCAAINASRSWHAEPADCSSRKSAALGIAELVSNFGGQFAKRKRRWPDPQLGPDSPRPRRSAPPRARVKRTKRRNA